MFLPTMTDAEIQQEARKDFFELSTKVKLALERFNKRHCDLLNNSGLKINDVPRTLIGKTVEKQKWVTRRRNTWHSYFRFDNCECGEHITIQYFLYTAIYRDSGTEYIFLHDLQAPLAEHFTKHFIDRYKERHLVPHGIDVGSMPVPLYFQLHNPNSFVGTYYKASDLNIREGKYTKFWIGKEGIYVTDYIEGMLTYITFMDKDDLSPLKAKVYEEENVWHQATLLIDEKQPREVRSRAAYQLANNPRMAAVMERFANRNVADNGDGGKQEMLRNIRETLSKQALKVEEAYAEADRRDKELMRRNRVTGALDLRVYQDMVDIKEYHLPPHNKPE